MERRTRHEAICNGLWFLFFALASSVWCLTAADRLSATFDEPIYLRSGLERWRTGSYLTLMKLGTMPLPVDVATLPVYLWERVTGQQLDADAESTLRVARTTALVFWWLLLAYVWRWGRLLAEGPWAARLAVALVACEPTLLAHAGLATTDVALAACLLVLLYHFRTGRDRGWGWRVGLPAACYGVALLAKASALVFGPLLLIVLELERLIRQHQPLSGLFGWSFLRRFSPFSSFGRDLVQIVAIGLLVTFVYIGCDWKPQSSFVAWARGLPAGEHRDRMLAVAENLRIFPNAGEGIVRQIKHNMHGHGTYLLGQQAPRAIWYYFPVALSMKLSPALLLLPLLVLLVRPRSLANSACLAAVVLLAFSLTCRVQIGVRFFLPLMALLAVGVSAALVRVCQERASLSRWLTGAAAAAVGWAVLSAATCWPHGLCYINPFWGGSRDGYLLLSDSNYDWGQGLKELADWQRRHDVQPLHVWYFGSDSLVTRMPVHYLPVHALRIERPEDLEVHVRGGHFAVGITLVHGMVCDTPAHWKAVELLRSRRPVARTTTFFIYDFTEQQSAQQ